MSFEFTPLSDEEFMAAAGSSTRNQSYTPIYALKLDVPRQVYFVTDPWNSGTSDWVACWVASAFDGLRGGYSLPPGCAEFPVQANDHAIMNLIAPSVKYPPKDGKVTPRKKLYVNVVDEEGNQIILSLTGERGKDLIRQFEKFRALSSDFSCTKFPWQITYTGSVGSYALDITPLINEAPIELPEPIDIGAVLTGIRQRVDEFVAEINGQSAREEEELHEAFDALNSLDQNQQDFSQLSDARLKNLLIQKGVVIPPRSSRSALIELAANHL